jgi:PKD repeat protein
MTEDLKPRMAYFAIKTLTHVLGGYRIVERLDLGNEDDFVLRLMKDKNEAIAFWTVDEEHEVTLPIGAGNGTLTDMVGNQSAVSWETIDGLRVNISQSPHYLMTYISAKFECNPEKPKATEQVTFNASESYPQTNITSYEWNFGDKNITRVTEPVINHTYALPGKYNVTLRVTGKNLWNTMTRTIMIHYVTDLNKDGTINILDIFIVANAFGSKPEDPNWNAVADLNKDGTVNILDIFAVAWDFGKTI